MKDTLRQIGLIFLVLGIGTLVVLVQLAPGWPKTIIGWLVIIFIGIPLYLSLEGLAESFWEKVDHSRVGTWVSSRTAGAEFSWIRIGYRLSIVLLIILSSTAAWMALSDYLSPVREFITQHFSWW